MPGIFEIGDFRLDSTAGVLMREGKPTPLGPRAVAVLAALVARPNEYVSKASLLDAGWPHAMVEEGNVAMQIVAIRRVLAPAGGAAWIETLPRRGYRFLGPVKRLTDESAAPATGVHAQSNLPLALSSFVGRERELVELKSLLSRKRLITIQGVGGIGKTRLALQVAAEVMDAYRDGVWLVELASIQDPALVATTVARVLGVPEQTSRSSTSSLLDHLKSRQILLVLDNCEHVIDAGAALADAVLRHAGDVAIIATSREPLRVSGEQSYGLLPLSLPKIDACEAVLNSDAVELFVERVQQQVPGFTLTPERAVAVASICIHLDGIPLALELAAARARSLSIEQINGRLSDRFRLLTNGARTTVPRQQTLRATLDWSHDLLPDDERTVLRRLAIFPAPFSLEAACAVASDERMDGDAVIEHVAQLVSRSLVISDTIEAGARYRLLETVRAYALEKLEESGEADVRRRRHAAFLQGLFEHELQDWLSHSDHEWRTTYLSQLASVRAALDWALGSGADAEIVPSLTGASGALWPTLGLFAEGTQRLKAAMAYVGAQTSDLDRARLWFWLSRCLAETPAEALPALEQAIALYRRVQHPIGLGLSLVRLARVLALMGKPQDAEASLAEARPLLESRGARAGSYFHFNAGFVRNRTGDIVGAQWHYERALEFARHLGDDLGMLATMGNLANEKFASGDLEGAIQSTRDLVALIRSSAAGTRRLLGYALMNLAGMLLSNDDIYASLAAAREGLPLLVADGSAWSFSDYGALLAGRQGNFAKAAVLAGYSDQAYAANGGKRSNFTLPQHERLRSVLAQNLSAEELQRLLQEGANLTEVQACRMALEG